MPYPAGQRSRAVTCSARGSLVGGSSVTWAYSIADSRPSAIHSRISPISSPDS
ncbi:hypothetical protein AB0M48_14670 [Lentzea sp. NPDC051208]|uniref:hypothetical protein n=1 Tax=Lentzea sp. NPDC051208 TaxID=3154642 RepID=UPI003444814A